MPEKATMQKAKKDMREGKRPSTAAGEFVREEIHHVREGKHGARSTKQAIAIGLSKARRAGVPLKPPKKGQASAETERAAKRDVETGQGKRKPRAPSRRRSVATSKALKKEPSKAGSRAALSRQTRRAAAKRTASERSAAARKAAASRTPEQRSASARKAARTRAERRASGEGR